MRTFLLLLSTFLCSAAVPFDNALTEAPRIECGHGKITMDIETEHGAPSYVFAKGHFNKEGCSFRNETHVTFNFDKCNVVRKREINPKGMAYSMSVVVQLHKLFITKVDRAYNVRCFYQEAEKSVGTEMGISDLPTQMLESQSPPPKCDYILHKDSPHGPIVKYAQVGDVVYHEWNCPSDVYAVLIHSCDALDGKGSSSRIIDDKGCSTEEFVISQLVYSKDLTRVSAVSSAFNFPDTSSVTFNCQIKFCHHANECSDITPPRCGIFAEPHNGQNKEAIGTPVQGKDDVILKQGNNDTLIEELNNDQLFTTSSEPTTTTEATTTRVQTTVSTTSEGTTTVIIQTTTTLPHTTTSRNAAPTTSTKVLTTTAQPTVSPSASTTTSTTTTEGAFPNPNELIIIPKDGFPTPVTIREYLLNRHKDTGSLEEGSGVEISKDQTPPNILTGEPRNSSPKREMKRRDTIDVDISSPELTILEKDFEMPEALKSVEPSLDLPPQNSVCISLIGFWALSGFFIFCLSLVTVAIYKAQSYKRKFTPY